MKVSGVVAVLASGVAACCVAKAIPVCFDDGAGCVDLTAVVSTAAERAQLRDACTGATIGSPWFTICHQRGFNWTGPDGNYSWVADGEHLGYKLQEIPGMIANYSADIEAMAVQPFQGPHAWWLNGALGPPGTPLPAASKTPLRALPASWRLPLVLQASALGRLRDLPPDQRHLLYDGQAFNTPPSAVNRLPGFPGPGSLVLFSGVGKAYTYPFCSPGNASSSAEFVNTALLSFAHVMPWASTYSGDSGTMNVWLTETAGNDPLTGEWEFRIMPGATVKQIGCDLFPPPKPPFALKNGAVRSISFAYETTNRGVLAPGQEMELLGQLRNAMYNYTAAVKV